MKNKQQLQTEIKNAIKCEPLLDIAKIEVTANDVFFSLTAVMDCFAKKAK